MRLLRPFSWMFFTLFLVLFLAPGCLASPPPGGPSNSSNSSSTAAAAANSGDSPVSASASAASDAFNLSGDPTDADSPLADILKCNQEGSSLQGRETCYDRFIARKMSRYSPAGLLEQMDQGGASNAQMRLSCHEIAHSIGRNAFLRYNANIPDAFAQCTQVCHSGCYHGVLQAVFRPEPVPGQVYDPHLREEDLRARIRDVCHVEGGTRFQFQCLHGLGHALMYGLDNNLSLSLDICAGLSTEYDRQSCYGGEFMENVFSVNPGTRWINRTDPQYPCDAVGEQYRYQCYLMQTTVMAEIFGTDIPKIIQACKEAGNYTRTCLVSLGRDRSSLFRVQSREPYQDLAQIEPAYQMEYVNGLVYALVDNTWDGFYAFPFCSGLNDTEQTRACYKTSIDYMKVNLGIDGPAARSSCQKDAPEADREICVGIASA